MLLTHPVVNIRPDYSPRKINLIWDALVLWEEGLEIEWINEYEASIHSTVPFVAALLGINNGIGCCTSQ